MENLRRSRNIRHAIRQKSARAGFCRGEREATPLEFAHDPFLNPLALRGNKIRAEDLDHTRLHGIEGLPGANQAKIDLIRPSAIPDLQSRVFSKLETDEFFDRTFAKADHSINPTFLGLDPSSECAQSRKHKIGKHRVQLARRARHQEKMRRRPRGLRDRRNIKTRRRAIRIRQNLGALGNHCLTQHALDELISARSQSGLNVGTNHRVSLKFSTEKFRNHLASDVISRGSQTACNEQHLGATTGFQHSIANGRSVGNCRLTRQAQTEWKNLARDPSRVGVLHATKKQFRADVQNLDGHFTKSPQAKASIQVLTMP